GRMNGGVMQVDGVETSHQQFFAAEELSQLHLPLWYRDMLMDVQQAELPVFSPPYVADKIVDQIANVRPFIGHDRLIAVGACVVVQRDDGCILVVRRQDNGQWSFPSGYSDIGESVAYTAVREVEEETNLQIKPERLLGIYSSSQFHHTFPNNDQVKNVVVVFLARWIAGEPKPDVTEISKIEWMAPDEILRCLNGKFYTLAKQVINHLEKGVFVI
ncbi:MAG: NUDIX domain-containing protein, partial [Chloroflexi bacterium]|nr:NUDIX domain-containing protein [Chloroflexota bacterium]